MKHQSTTTITTTRPSGRWTSTALAAAVTAAIAAAAFGVHASAAPGDGDTTFTPITPCRLFDDRPAP
ncbi:MAG: hypothetical protein AAFY28_19660, partial [Actinomycetota bacterium]